MNVGIVMGVGPVVGMGVLPVSRFAGLGLKVFVAGRDRAKLGVRTAQESW